MKSDKPIKPLNWPDPFIWYLEMLEIANANTDEIFSRLARLGKEEPKREEPEERTQEPVQLDLFDWVAACALDVDKDS